MTKINQIRTPRDKPLKQNIRVWFNYLQTAIKWNGKIDPNSKTKEVFNFPINKEYYRAWHLPQVRKLKFDQWWAEHKQLFVHKQFINVRVLNELSLSDAIKEVRSQLIGKVDQKSNFHISTKKFRYVEVDDYLKCYKLRKQGLTYNEIAIKIARSYRTKSKSKNFLDFSAFVVCHSLYFVFALIVASLIFLVPKP